MPRFKRVRVVDVWSDYPNFGSSRIRPPDGDNTQGGVGPPIFGNTPVIPPPDFSSPPLEDGDTNDPTYIPNVPTNSDLDPTQCKLYSELFLRENLLRGIPATTYWKEPIVGIYEPIAKPMLTDGIENVSPGVINGWFPTGASTNRAITYKLPSPATVDRFKLWYSTRSKNASLSWNPSPVGSPCRFTGVTLKFYSASGTLLGSVSRHVPPNSITQWTYIECPEVMLIHLKFGPLEDVSRVDIHLRGYQYGLTEVEMFGTTPVVVPPTIPPVPSTGIIWKAGAGEVDAITDLKNHLIYGASISFLSPIDGSLSIGNDAGPPPSTLIDGNPLTYIYTSNKYRTTWVTLPVKKNIDSIRYWVGKTSDSVFVGGAVGSVTVGLYDVNKVLLYMSEECGRIDVSTVGKFKKHTLYDTSGDPLALNVKYIEFNWTDDFSRGICEIQAF